METVYWISDSYFWLQKLCAVFLSRQVDISRIFKIIIMCITNSGEQSGEINYSLQVFYKIAAWRVWYFPYLSIYKITRLHIQSERSFSNLFLRYFILFLIEYHCICCGVIDSDFFSRKVVSPSAFRLFLSPRKSGNYKAEYQFESSFCWLPRTIYEHPLESILKTYAGPRKRDFETHMERSDLEVIALKI